MYRLYTVVTCARNSSDGYDYDWGKISSLLASITTV
jgi:hypothetical protein